MRQMLSVYDAIAKLASIERHNSVTFDANRRENVAEHSYSLVVFGSALAQELNQAKHAGLDVGKVAQFSIVHDLVEAFMDEGDISVYAPQEVINAKKDSEEKALRILAQKTQGYPWIVDTIKEYERQATDEARFVYALDKMVVHMNVILSDTHHAKPTFEAYVKTEKVARAKITRSYPVLLPYFEGLCQVFRRRPHFFTD